MKLPLIVVLSLFGPRRLPAHKRQSTTAHNGATVLEDHAVTPGAIDAQLATTELCSATLHTGTVPILGGAEQERVCVAGNDPVISSHI